MIGAAALLVGATGDVSPWPGYFAAGLSGTALLLACGCCPNPRHRKAARRGASLLDLAGLRVALTTSSIGLLLLTSFIVVLSLAAFESTLSLAIKTLHDRSLADPAHSACCRPWSTGPRDSVTDTSRRAARHRARNLRLPGPGHDGRPRVPGAALRGPDLRGRMAVGGTLVSTLSLILLSVAVQQDSYGLLCLAMAVFVVGLAFVTPSLQSLISRRTSPAQQGHVLGVTQSLSSLARIAGPVLGIRLFAYSPQVPLWSAAAIMAMAALLTIIAVRSGGNFVRSPERDVLQRHGASRCRRIACSASNASARKRQSESVPQQRHDEPASGCWSAHRPVPAD